MPSKHEDTSVEELNVSDLSDEELRDIAENDSRTTAQAKAQAELNRRENDSSDEAANDAGDGNEAPSFGEVKNPSEYEGDLDLPEPVAKTELRENPSGNETVELVAKEDAGTLRDSAGNEYQAPSLIAGAGQVQAEVDKEQASGVRFGDGSPPDDSLTVAGVTGNRTLQDLVNKAEADEG